MFDESANNPRSSDRLRPERVRCRGALDTYGSGQAAFNAGAQEIQELPNGLAFRYTAEQYAQVTQFIANERLCCPFFTFVLEVTPANGPIWLWITGRDGVKDFLQSELRSCAC